MKPILICTLFFLVLGIATAIQDGAPSVMLQRQFDAWCAQHGKEYSSIEERNQRIKNFMASIARIEKLNSERQSEDHAIFSLNKFSDMTPEEFRAAYLLSTPIEPSEKIDVLEPRIAVEDLPQIVDWQDQSCVTPVKNQQQCGSCWAFSTVEAIESAWILAGKGSVDDTNLSVQQIVDCDDVDDGCNGGNPPTAYAYVMKAGGLESNISYPYTAENGQCVFKSAEIVASISNWQYATKDKSESLFQQNLASWGPLSICVDAARWQDYQSGVMAWYQCSIFPLLDHCVQATGFVSNSSTPYYTVRNSWGFDWGIEGYIWLEMNKDTCGLTHETTWPSI